MTNTITNRQMFFILILTLTSYTSIDFPHIVAMTTGRSGWMLILAFALVFALFVAVIASLGRRFEGKALVDYGHEIIGMVPCVVICVYYLLYFMLVGVVLDVRLVGFLSSNFLPHTNKYLMLGVSIALFGYVSYRGITNVARLFELYGVAFLLTTVAICAVMLREGMVYNIMPFYNPSEVRGFLSAVPRFAFPFGGIEVLLIVPLTKANKRAPQYAFLTLLFVGGLYVLIVESAISILGINNTIVYSDAFIEAVKVVEIPIIERTDIFYLTVGLTSLFAGMIMIYTAALEYVCRLVPKIGRAVATIAIGALLFAACVVAMGMRGFTETMDGMFPVLVAISSLLIPGTLWLIAKIRHKPAH